VKVKKHSTKTELRKRAEAGVAGPAPKRADKTGKLIHELEVHQVELELQNEELRAARELTEAALARYTEIFDFSPLGYAVLDGDGAIREINHAGAQLLGRERSRCVKTRFVSHVTTADAVTIDRLLGRALISGKAEHCEVQLVRQDALRSARITAAALRRDQPAFMVAFEDISERKAKEGELARSEEALRELNRRKDEFLAMLSHELRNPLAPIRTSVAVLQLAPAGSEAATSAVTIIERAATHLTRLVDDLLDVTRITRGKIELQREPLDLVDLVRRTADDHYDSIAHRRLKLEVNCKVDKLWIDGDGARLVQVLSNVIGNAEKFTPAGGRITIECAPVAENAVMLVRDTGIGVGPELLGQVFEPFAQGPQQLAREPGGLGLGLAMVKALVELHGGHVALRSEGLGRGTEVEITLPLQSVVPRQRDASAVTTPRPRRVLVIEDKPDNALSLEQALSFMGHDVRIAYDGLSGLSLAAEFRPDVVLCDIGLPDIDGHEVARRIRLDPVLRGTCLVALSGYVLEQDVAKAKAAGFDQHLAKPASLEQLQRVIVTAERAPDDNALH